MTQEKDTSTTLETHPIDIPGLDPSTGEANNHEWPSHQIPHKLVLRKLSPSFEFLIEERRQMLADLDEIIQNFKARRSQIADELSTPYGHLSDIYPTKGEGNLTVSGHRHYYPDWRRAEPGMNSDKQRKARNGEGRSKPVKKSAKKPRFVKYGHYIKRDFQCSCSAILPWELKLIVMTEEIIQPIRVSIRHRNNAIQGLAYLPAKVLADEDQKSSILLFDDYP